MIPNNLTATEGTRPQASHQLTSGLPSVADPKGETLKVAYIAGPYRAPTEWGVTQNILKAQTAALKYWRKGFAVFCPHKNTAYCGGAVDDSVWLDGGLEILSRCDVIVLIRGWESSEGAKAEKDLAEELELEVIFD